MAEKLSGGAGSLPIGKLLLLLIPSMVISVVVGGFLVLYLVGPMESGGSSLLPKSAQHDKAKKPIFFTLEPILVNFVDARRARFLQIKIQLMTYDKKVEEILKEYEPVIRNDLGLLLSDQNQEQLATKEGKEILRKKILDTVQQILRREVGIPGVEDAYITDMVMQ